MHSHIGPPNWHHRSHDSMAEPDLWQSYWREVGGQMIFRNLGDTTVLGNVRTFHFETYRAVGGLSSVALFR